ncbi:MAG: hypothetical protein COX65_07740 [Elusimicrobia bacterium CG_4_10_14_0_2_um_filter_56_8]|nr:MAG: hypothetical protein AUJ51_12060 [Elusimicrobia bacterium CG1_02_56_21]PJA12993.1 MAG: hypothetical protein COX65_07740 [Elusimicrobia bacterium CG_4_10_14_0_2_um_filter_56_8]
MFKKITLALFPVLALSAASFSQTFSLNSSSAGDISDLKTVGPSRPAPVLPPGITIASYTTDEEFTFESQVKPAMDARINALKAAGITTLGGRIVELGNDYSFVIDYLPTVKNGAALPPAVLIETYKNGAGYWLKSEAEEARKTCAANFRAAGLPVLSSYLYEAGGDNAFAVDYLVKNSLRPTRDYDVKFGNYTAGKYTFESEAVKNIPAYLAMFRQAGVPAMRGKAVSRSDGDYAVTVEYVVKTNRFGPRPRYSVSRYDSREVFTFDKEALKASKAALPSFSKAGVSPLSAIVRPEGRDYSFSVDFLVGNIYQQGGVIPSAAIDTYQAQETFTFDTEAKKARDEKAAAFEAAGLGVVGSAVTGSLGSFTYIIDYVTRAGQGGHQPRQPR